MNRRRNKVILIMLGSVAVAAAAILFGPGLVLTPASSGMCGNERVAEYPSPDGALKVVVFQRDCGATTGFSTQASLISGTDKLPDKAGNLFVADTDHGAAPAAAWGGPTLGVRWEGVRAVVLQHDERARVFKAEKHVRGTSIRYTWGR